MSRVSCRVELEGRSYDVREGETVLDALLRGGANVPSSCRRGTCQTCVMRAVEGDPGERARAGLPPAMRELGCFLPCTAQPRSDLRIERPNLAELCVPARIAGRSELSRDVVRFQLEPETRLTWRAGQFVNVRRADGLVRSYSLASIPEEDDFLELHVRRIEDGAMSRWLCDALRVDDEIEIQGPVGTCVYRPEDADRDLLLIATGTGLAPVLGVARDALHRGHRCRVSLFHGARDASDLYLQDELRALAKQHPTFTYVPCVSRGDAPPGFAKGRATDVALREHPELMGYVVYLCGKPEMVHDGRALAIAAGAAPRDILADPFEPAHRMRPLRGGDG